MLKVNRRLLVLFVAAIVFALVLLFSSYSSTVNGGLFDSLSHLSDIKQANGNSPNNSGDNAEKATTTDVPTSEKLEVTKEGQIKDKQLQLEQLLDPCTVVNPVNHQFIDLSSLSITNDGKPLPWLSKAYDIKRNYTLGICANPMKKTHEFGSLNSSLVGAYYLHENTYYSMGQFSTTPRFSGRKLTLTYENGSYCDNLIDSKTGEKLRKSTIITFTCDREMLAKASVHFVAQANECTYFFEVRSHHACPTAPKANNLAAIWIFLLILLAALAVYFSGGILYKQLKVKK